MTQNPHPALVLARTGLQWVSERAGFAPRELQDLVDHGVFVFPGGSRTQIKRAFGGILDESRRALYLDIVSNLTVSFSNSHASPDCQFDENHPEFDWLRLRSTLPEFARQEFDREGEYERTLAKFAKVARKIRLIDPYFLEALASPKSHARMWLLEQLLKDSNVEIEIVSDRLKPNLDGLRRNAAEEKAFLQNALDKYATCLRFGVDRLKIRVVSRTEMAKVKRDLHARSIQFRFDEGATTFSLQKGVDGFQHTPLRSDDCHLISGTSFNREFDIFWNHCAAFEIRF